VIPPAYRLITSLSVLELAHNPLTSPPAQVCLYFFSQGHLNPVF